MVAIFEKKFSKVGKQKWLKCIVLDTLEMENFDEIGLSQTVKDIEVVLWFHWPLCGIHWEDEVQIQIRCVYLSYLSKY